MAHHRHDVGDPNRVYVEDRAVHQWYRFVLSYPPHLVREYAAAFELGDGQTILDPFCETGTTLVESKKRGLHSVGLEAHPMAHFAGATKIDWSPDPDGLLAHARSVAVRALAELRKGGVEDEPIFGTRPSDEVPLRTLTAEQMGLLLSDSISPLPLHKALVLLNCLRDDVDERYAKHELLTLARSVVASSSNLHFGPEVGVGKPRSDAAVVGPWLAGVGLIAQDLRALAGQGTAPASVHLADARSPQEALPARSIDAVITSPPYPNEKDYTRTTRLESVLLGFVEGKQQLQDLKKGLMRSNTRGVYREDDDDRWVAGHPEIHRIAAAIEQRRLELGKTSGFERMYPRVTKLYFGGMARHFAGLRSVLRPGARLAYVVGDQASYLRVMIRTGQLLADIACSLGYELERIDLFRTRLATATREQLREEVVVLRWPG